MRLDLAGKEVLVIGLGLSGRSAARFCAERGARVTAADRRTPDRLGSLEGIPSSVRIAAGGELPDPADFDLVVPSPGVPLERYAGRARRVWGDIELAFRALDVPTIAVTGTNGKSTTVRMIEAMLRAADWRARAAGNVGTPALSLVGMPLDVVVLEVSSFQLEAVDAFRPRVAVVLNLSPDHLDRHGDLEAYGAAKARIFARQHADDALVLNFDDPRVRAMAVDAPGRVFGVSLRGPVRRGVFFDSGAAVWCDGERSVRLDLSSLELPGLHNLENALAALCAVLALGADPRSALFGLRDFRGLPHRCEVVARAAGVTWVNDSKATNPGAAKRSLEGFDAPVLWLAGGRDKDLDFGELADAAAARGVKHALLFGETAGKLAAALADRVPVTLVEDLESAVGLAADEAADGDVVLLAPACASFDQFESFEDRGDAFRRAVERTVGGASEGTG
ncbi:MAG: UDP-N-acetylmuramoyl-L-alanine--D-glutamate ligase [Myxococcota bacterium]